MINKTVLMFEKKVPEVVVEFLENHCSQREDQLVHILEVKSHSIVIVSFQQGPAMAMNECLRALSVRFPYTFITGAAEGNTNYIKLGDSKNSQLTQVGIDKVKDLF